MQHGRAGWRKGLRPLPRDTPERWIPAYLWTSPEGVDICDVNDICFNTGSRYMQQLELRAGATFRF
jgi:hypothetical protein